MQFWDLVTGQEGDSPWAGVTDGVREFIVGNLGSRIVVATGDWVGKVRCWDSATRQLLLTIDLFSPVSALSSVKDGDDLLLIIGTDRGLQTIRLNANRILSLVNALPA